ncbi:TPA: N-acetyltransferase, partial [Campylobacter jejuni]|nr:N-acetyltransferase [Campylobacter jejuni]
GVFKNDDKRNFWKLKYSNYWSFSSCVEIDHNYKSLGIGTFVINKILEIALSYVPEAEFHDILSKGNDENEESCKNRIRRDKLYKNLGFIFNENNTGFSIDSISNLKIRKDFDYIQEVRIFDMCNQLAKLQYLKAGDDKLLQYYKDDFYKEKRKNERNKLMYFVLIALVVWIVYLLK